MFLLLRCLLSLGWVAALSSWSCREGARVLGRRAAGDEDDERRLWSGRKAANAVVTTTQLGNTRRCVEGKQAAAGWPS